MFTGPAGDSAARLLASFLKGSSVAEAMEKCEVRSMKEEKMRMVAAWRNGRAVFIGLVSYFLLLASYFFYCRS